MPNKTVNDVMQTNKVPWVMNPDMLRQVSRNKLARELRDGDSLAAFYHHEAKSFDSLLGGIVRIGNDAFLFRYRMNDHEVRQMAHFGEVDVYGLFVIKVSSLLFWTAYWDFHELLRPFDIPLFRDSLPWPNTDTHREVPKEEIPEVLQLITTPEKVAVAWWENGMIPVRWEGWTKT